MGSFTCHSIGLAPITDRVIRETPTSREDFPIKYEIRQGVAIMGGMVCDGSDDPFDEHFYNNMVRGAGYTMEAAERAFEKAWESMKESIWA
jgi:hypothetical protein